MFGYPFDFQGDIPYANVTLDTQLDFAELLENTQFIKISEVMDINAANLCYTYQ